jgi:ribosomal protein S18 acetylase RimI-like enzyme
MEDRAWISGRSVAEERARLDAMIPLLLPAGKDTPGHIFRFGRLMGGETVGFVWLGVLPGNEPKSELLFDVYVVPEQRRHGHRFAMLTQVLREAKESGTERVSLNVRGDNEAAQSLCRSLGFEPIPARSENEKHIEMKRRL